MTTPTTILAARLPRFLAAFVAASTVLLAVAPARATPNFPAALASDINLASPPACALCHTDGNQGGTGTVNTPFGKNMRARGLVAYDTGSLSAALTLMSDEKVDSAGACLPDIEELQAGGNPNSAGDVSACDGGVAPMETATTTLLPTYGCSTSPRGGASPGLPVIVVAASVSLVLARRRRRARRSSGPDLSRR